MLINDLLVCLQMTADKYTHGKPSDCYVNLPCGCRNPGKEIKCENCEYLESCLSRATKASRTAC